MRMAFVLLKQQYDRYILSDNRASCYAFEATSDKSKQLQHAHINTKTKQCHNLSVIKHWSSHQIATVFSTEPFGATGVFLSFRLRLQCSDVGLLTYLLHQYRLLNSQSPMMYEADDGRVYSPALKHACHAASPGVVNIRHIEAQTVADTRVGKGDGRAELH